MAEIKLAAEARDEFGKGASRRLRREGRVPAVVYGDGEAPRHVSVVAHDLDLALKQPKVILEIGIGDDWIPTAPRDIQRDAVKLTLKHIDLVALNRAEVRARQIEARVVAEAEQRAEELELDPIALASIVTDLLAEDVDPEAVVDQAVEQLQAEVKAQAIAAAAAAAAEDAAAAAEEAEGEGGEGAGSEE